MRSLILSLAILLCPAAAWAEVSIKATSAVVLSTSAKPEVYGDLVVLPAGGESLKPTAAAIVEVTTDAKFVTVKARQSLFGVGQLTKIRDNAWVLTGEGRYLVEATTFDPNSGIDQAHIEVVVGNDPSPIDPNPRPNPDPVDPIDPPAGSIADLVRTWRASEPAEYATVWETAAARIEAGEIRSDADLLAVLEGIGTAADKVREPLNQAIEDRLPRDENGALAPGAAAFCREFAAAFRSVTND